MKKLAILDNSGVFKVDDSDTLIPFGRSLIAIMLKLIILKKQNLELKI